MILLVDAIPAAEKVGIAVPDMGKGQSDYKDRLCNGSVPISEGEVALSSLRASCRKGVSVLREHVRDS